MKNNVRINHADNSIVITKAFSQKASKYGSEEYKLLKTIREDYVGYTIVVNHSTKRSSGINNIKLADMEAYIKKHDKDGNLLATFNGMVNEERGENLKRTNFFKIKKWFFETYPDLKEIVA